MDQQSSWDIHDKVAGIHFQLLPERGGAEVKVNDLTITMLGTSKRGLVRIEPMRRPVPMQFLILDKDEEGRSFGMHTVKVPQLPFSFGIKFGHYPLEINFGPPHEITLETWAITTDNITKCIDGPLRRRVNHAVSIPEVPL